MPRTTHSRLSCRIPCFVPQGQLLCRGGVAKVSPSITCCAHLSLTTMPTSCSQRRWIRLGDILKPSDHCCTSRDQVFSPLSALVLKISCSAETINALLQRSKWPRSCISLGANQDHNHHSRPNSQMSTTTCIQVSASNIFQSLSFEAGGARARPRIFWFK